MGKGAADVRFHNVHAARDERNFPALDIASRIDVYDASPPGESQDSIMRGHVLLSSRRRVRAQQELTIDYGLYPKTHRIPRRCGSPKCRGPVNRKL